MKNLILIFGLVMMLTQVADARRRVDRPVPTRPPEIAQNTNVVRQAIARIQTRRAFNLNNNQISALSKAATKHGGAFTRLVLTLSNMSRDAVTTMVRKLTHNSSLIAESAQNHGTIQVARSGVNSVVNAVSYTIRGDITGREATRVEKISGEVASAMASGRTPREAFEQSPTLRRSGPEGRERFQKRCR